MLLLQMDSRVSHSPSGVRRQLVEGSGCAVGWNRVAIPVGPDLQDGQPENSVLSPLDPSTTKPLLAAHIGTESDTQTMMVIA